MSVGSPRPAGDAICAPSIASPGGALGCFVVRDSRRDAEDITNDAFSRSDGSPHDAEWTAMTESIPLMVAAAGAVVACGIATSTLGLVPIGWAGLGAMLISAWLRTARMRTQPIIVISPRLQRVTFISISLVLVNFLSLLAWLPTDARWPYAVPLRQAGLMLLACAGALVFAPIRALAGLAVLTPSAQWLAMTNSTQLATWSTPGFVVSVTVFSLFAAGFAAAARRAWLCRARWSGEWQRRLAVAESSCQSALKADEEKTRFLNATSHDLRQPVHALGLLAATLEKRLRGTCEESLANNVMLSVEGLERSLNAMLDVSHLDAGAVVPNIQRFALRDIFRRLQMQFAGKAELSGLALRFSSGGKWVTSDPQLLERILGNLIQNALKYTVRGGVTVVARTTETHLNIEVWDSGVGMTAEELPRIFDEYYQINKHSALRQRGTGMGLAIVRRLVHLLGHRLTVASRPDRGTMFRIGIECPAMRQIQDAAAPADTLPVPPDRVRSVLIVEDDEVVREGLAALLSESGHVALCAASLAEALQILRVLDLPPDLLLTDLRLGDGMDGTSVIKEVRNQCGAGLPAIVITGDSLCEDVRRMCADGHPVIFKPVDPTRLLDCVRGLMR